MGDSLSLLRLLRDDRAHAAPVNNVRDGQRPQLQDTAELVIFQAPRRPRANLFWPLSKRCCDKLLGAGIQRAEKRRAPGWIEFSENIIDQEQGRRAFIGKDSRLAQLERECERSLLPFG